MYYKYYHKIPKEHLFTNDALNIMFTSFLCYFKNEKSEKAWNVLYSPTEKNNKSLEDRLFIYARRYGYSDKIISCYQNKQNQQSGTDQYNCYDEIVVSICQYFINDFRNAIYKLKELISKLESSEDKNRKDQEIYPHALIFYCLCHLYSGEAGEAKLISEKISQHCETMKNNITLCGDKNEQKDCQKQYYYILIHNLINQAKIELELNNYQDSYNACQEALKLFDETEKIKISYPILKAKILSLQARTKCVPPETKLDRKEDNSSESDMNKAIDLFRDCADIHSQTICYLFLMQIYIYTNETGKINNIRKIYEDIEYEKTPYMKALYFQIEGDLIQGDSLKDYQNKIKCYEKAIREIRTPDAEINLLVTKLENKISELEEKISSIEQGNI